MAAKEMYDYLSSASPDNDVTLSVTPTRVIVEGCTKKQKINVADDNSEERISFSTASIFDVTLLWDKLNESDSGTVFDFFNDNSKGNGMAESFKWSHPTDGYTYVVRFNSKVIRSRDLLDLYGIREVKLRVLGRV